MKINEIAKKLIPQSCYYCYEGDKICPFMELRTFSKEEAMKIMDKGHIDCVPVGKEKRNKITLEYCNYLKAYLIEQDYIKDCEININIDDQKNIRRTKYAKNMKKASKDKEFIKRTMKCQKEFDNIN